MKTAVVGCGYWGPNIVRNLASMSNLVYVCDLDMDLANTEAAKYDGVTAIRWAELLKSDVQAIAIVTPPSTHLALAAQAMAAGKHVFIEKPLASTVDDSEQLLNLSQTYNNLVCCVGHIFVFSPEIRQLKKVVDSGLIGQVQAITIQRKNWGKFQQCGVELDLLPHDLSIIQYITGLDPVLVDRTKLVQDGISVAGTSSYLVGDIDAHISYSWAHTEKVRKLILLGSAGVLQYDMAKPKELGLWVDRIIGQNNLGSYQVLEVKDHSEPLRSELQFWLDLINPDTPDQPNLISFALGNAVVRAIGE